MTLNKGKSSWPRPLGFSGVSFETRSSLFHSMFNFEERNPGPLNPGRLKP